MGAHLHRLLLGAALLTALAPVAAQSDAERARMAYEQQQREYWRAQEAARVAEAQRLESERRNRENAESWE